MFPDHQNVVAETRKRLRAEIAEASITEHDDAVILPDLELRWDLKCGRYRFREHSGLVVDRIRHGVQVAFGDREKIREGAIAADDPEHGTMRAVSGVTRDPARIAGPATAIDLADHAAPLEGSPERDADELMSEHTAEAVIAREDLQIGLADAGAEDADEYFSGARAWFGTVGLKAGGGAVERDGAHVSPTEYRGLPRAKSRGYSGWTGRSSRRL